MKKHFRMIIVCGMFTIFYIASAIHIAHAELVVELVADPEVKSVSLDALTKKIIITARTNQEDVRFTWKIDGAGSLEGIASGAGITYLIPNSIEMNDTQLMQATITVMVSNPNGESANSSVTLTLLAPVKLDAAYFIELLKKIPEMLSVESDQPVMFIEDVMVSSSKNVKIEYTASQGQVTLQQEENTETRRRTFLYHAPANTNDNDAIVVKAINMDTGETIAEKNIQIKRSDLPPQALHLSSPIEIQLSQEFPTMLPVIAGTYRISEYLQRYLRFLQVDAIQIDMPFSIQSGEVTVGEFRRYANTLDEVRRQQLGAEWERDQKGVLYQENRPVENITWQEATDYAAWLSQKTGWDLRLPTVYQWAAAGVQYPDVKPILETNDSQPVSQLRNNVDHLFGNLREWSSETCQNGKHRLLGENYMTDVSDPENLGQEYCAKNEKWSGVGFRLVKIK